MNGNGDGRGGHNGGGGSGSGGHNGGPKVDPTRLLYIREGTVRIGYNNITDNKKFVFSIGVFGTNTQLQISRNLLQNYNDFEVYTHTH